MNVRSHEQPLKIGADHPALPGHFPGAPVVPGVVLLDHVILAAESWLAQPLTVASLVQAKFNSPLLPEQSAVLRLQLTDVELRFVIANAATADTIIAQGMMRLSREPS